jgi:hypothetical protein
MLLPETAKFDSQKFRFLKLFQNLNRLWTGTSYFGMDRIERFFAIMAVVGFTILVGTMIWMWLD